ncbi:MAG TPA: hypothetical protein VM735_04930 [Candidatus Kapabacteria bacterium]|jgi:hypothetical protein|nr:hypothetical protein [Candidatus Kapabacteria bacterium]
MSAVKLDELIHQMENYLECWKQFNQYLVQARTKKCEPDDETQFLEIKSVLTQELELILASVQTENPSKDDILSLIGGTPSIRYVSDLNENAVRNLENQWHKIYIGFQSLLGQLKVQQRQTEKKSLFSFFKK